MRSKALMSLSGQLSGNNRDTHDDVFACEALELERLLRAVLLDALASWELRA